MISVERFISGVDMGVDGLKTSPLSRVWPSARVGRCTCRTTRARNVAFVGVNFTSNRVVAASSRGGAVYASTEGASRVTFDKCLFDGNDASGGFGGGLYAHGGRVIAIECNFTGNFAKTGGGASFRSGGVVSSSIFVDNNATQDVGGGVHITSATDIVDGAYACAIQRSLFRNNRARRAGGGLFAYGRARMLANEFSSNALTGAVNVPAYANLNDYYACTDMSSTGCTLFDARRRVYGANPGVRSVHPAERLRVHSFVVSGCE